MMQISLLGGPFDGVTCKPTLKHLAPFLWAVTKEAVDKVNWNVSLEIPRNVDGAGLSCYELRYVDRQGNDILWTYVWREWTHSADTNP